MPNAKSFSTIERIARARAASENPGRLDTAARVAKELVQRAYDPAWLDVQTNEANAIIIKTESRAVFRPTNEQQERLNRMVPRPQPHTPERSRPSILVPKPRRYDDDA